MSETKETSERGLRKERVGVVSSNKMDKTIVVTVDRLARHKRYKKVILHGHLTHSLYFLIPFSFFSKFILFYTEHNSFNKRRKIQFLRPVERFIYSSVISIKELLKFIKVHIFLKCL